MLQYALNRSNLHIQSFPGGYVANWSRISESAGSLTFRGARSSMALMRVAFGRHLHLVLDLGHKNTVADADPTTVDGPESAGHATPPEGRCQMYTSGHPQPRGRH